MKIKKELLFKLFAICLPLILIVLLEVLLRVCNYGNNLSLFIPDKTTPSLLHLNEKVSLRYFLQEKNATVGNMECFLAKKPENLIRIFVQGESTAIGFPYLHNGTFSRMLAYQLRQDLPDLNLELINLSMTALNSYALYDFADEIIAQQPDAVIINAGHNEYYGALGVGSFGTFGKNVSVGRLGIGLRKTKTGLLLSQLLSAVMPDGNKTDYEDNLMKRMVKKQEIPANSDLRQAGLRQYEKNLNETLAKYKRAGIRVYLTNTVCNLKDQKPFVSEEGPDAIRAIKHFESGHSYLEKGDTMRARAEFIQAKESDALPFRAPEEINEITKRLARIYNNVVFVDVRKALEDYAPGALIGKELMLEHLHPNLKGHYLISVALLESFRQSSFLYQDSNKPDYIIPGFDELPLTAVDSLSGEYATQILKLGWPFNEPQKINSRVEKSLVENMAGGFAVHQMNWEMGMQKLMDDYARKKDWKNALKISESLMLEYPYEYSYYKPTIQLCMEAKEYKKGIKYANRAFSLRQDPIVARDLVIFYLKTDSPDKTIPYLDMLISSGGQVDFRPMKEVVLKIIATKNKLAKNPEDTAVKQEIFTLYSEIGNTETAAKYGKL